MSRLQAVTSALLATSLFAQQRHKSLAGYRNHLNQLMTSFFERALGAK